MKVVVASTVHQEAHVAHTEEALRAMASWAVALVVPEALEAAETVEAAVVAGW